jgi:cysteine desulfurase
MRRIYLDNAATTALDPQVLDAMLPYMTEHFGNPSSIHSYGRATRSAIEKARKKVSGMFGVSPGEIFFTSGGTEANNFALQCSVRDLGVRRIISSPIEHHAVTHTVEALGKEGKVEVVWVKLLADGNIDLEDLERLLSMEGPTTLVSLMHANNEIGVLLDIKTVSALCAAHEAYFHCDTVQTVAHYHIDLQETPIHFISAAAHKFHGPKGVGFVYVNGDVHLQPLIYGGAQERNMRAGTENLYGIIGMAKALEIAYDELEETSAYIRSLNKTMRQRLIAEFPGIQFNSPEEGLYTVLNVLFPAHPKNDLLLINLDIQGIACSGGSACSSGSSTGSHVIAALNAPEGTAAVRFSFSKFNTPEDVEEAITRLQQVFGVTTATAG